MSNIAGFGNLGNSGQGGGGGGDQGDVDCTERVKECWKNVPLFCRFVFWTCISLLLVSFFMEKLPKFLQNEPEFTIKHFQLWRIITAPFASERGFHVLFSL